MLLLQRRLEYDSVVTVYAPWKVEPKARRF